MVSTPSAAQAILVAENDKRKRTQQTVEKVKANHLTRQLQMRLQYARLKVENGWQKQNLNEVENLYFHNSHVRGPPRPLAPAATIFTTTQLQRPASSPSPRPVSGPQPYMPTQQIGSNSTENGTSNDDDLVKHVLQAVETLSSQNQATAPHSIISTLQGTPPSTLEESRNQQVLQTVTEPSPGPLQPQTQDSVPTPTLKPITQTNSTYMPTLSSTPSKSTQSTSTNLTSTTSISSHYPSVKPPRTRNNKHPAGPKGAHQNLTTKDMVDFASTSNLTYDSFWSNHSASTPSRATAATTTLSRPALAIASPTSVNAATAPTVIATTTTPAPAMPIFASTLANHLFTAGVDLTSLAHSTLGFAPPPTAVDQSRTQ